MGRAVTVDVDNVMIDGIEHDAGDEVVISDAEFAALTSAGRFTDGTLTDDGEVADDEGDEVTTQGAVVAAPVALTAVATTAMTQAAITGGESPTEAEFNALRTDLVNTRTTVTALLADITALRTKQAALITALTGEGKPLASA
jgi:hypothetical protein